MKHISIGCIVALLVTFTLSPAMAGSADYTSQRQSQEDSYEDQIANKALQDYYRNNPGSAPDSIRSKAQKKTRASSTELHKQTFGDSSNSEVWGTKK